jgi:hypothetical protein
MAFTRLLETAFGGRDHLGKACFETETNVGRTGNALP